MRADPVAHLPRQVRILENLPDADALRGVVPAVRRKVRRQGVLAGVTEWGVADVVAERDCLRQRLVEAERRGERARHLGDLHGVRQAGHEVVALGVQEDLGLVLEPPEGLRMDDPVTVPLEGGAVLVGLLGPFAPPARRRPRGGRAEPFLLGLARDPVPAPQLGRRPDLLHGPMMPSHTVSLAPP